jgi:hypothetical protein
VADRTAEWGGIYTGCDRAFRLTVTVTRTGDYKIEQNEAMRQTMVDQQNEHQGRAVQ